MAFMQTAAPAAEPISLDEAKAFLRVDHADDDAFIGSLITTSRLQVETALDLALISQDWRWRGDVVTASPLALRPHPVRAIAAVSEIAQNGDVTELDEAAYTSTIDDRPARVSIMPARVRRAEVAFTAGFADTAAEVPAPIRQALLQLIAHWYENREPVAIGAAATRIPDTVSQLLMPYREARVK